MLGLIVFANWLYEVTDILPQLKSKQRALREIKSQLTISLGETITEKAWAYLNDTKDPGTKYGDEKVLKESHLIKH